MANEIQTAQPTGLTHYAVITDIAGEIYRTDTEEFEAPVTANWALYAVPTPEVSTTGLYMGDFPEAAAGTYSVVFYRQLGAGPAPSDPVVAIGEMRWGGTAEVTTTAPAPLVAESTGTLTVRRGDTLPLLFENLGSLVGASEIWFTAKVRESDPDRQALVQISLTDGLLYIAGKAATSSGNGVLGIVDTVSGDLLVTLEPEESRHLLPGKFFYDVQALISGAMRTLASGPFVVLADVTHAVA